MRRERWSPTVAPRWDVSTCPECPPTRLQTCCRLQCRSRIRCCKLRVWCCKCRLPKLAMSSPALPICATSFQMAPLVEALSVSSRIHKSEICLTFCIWGIHHHCWKWKAVVNRRSLSQSLFPSFVQFFVSLWSESCWRCPPKLYEFL